MLKHTSRETIRVLVMSCVPFNNQIILFVSSDSMEIFSIISEKLRLLIRCYKKYVRLDFGDYDYLVNSSYPIPRLKLSRYS